jgi:hypothetical protein
MHPRRTFLVIFLMLVAVSSAGAGSALASPAEVYDDTYCDPVFIDEDGNEWQDCYTVRAVIQMVELPSGDFKYTSNNIVTNTTTFNGTVVYSDSSTYQFTDLFKGGDYQVNRYYSLTELTFTNPVSGEVTTCNLVSNVVVIDGEPRHQTYSYDCGS